MDNEALKAPVPDPWKHRNDGMRCKTCLWFIEKTVNQPASDPRGAIGRCRRHAPTMGGYPVVFGMDWCGDHKLDENKQLVAVDCPADPGDNIWSSRKQELSDALREYTAAAAAAENHEKLEKELRRRGLYR